MWERYGMAVVEERRQDRRLGALEDYLRTEYGSTSGTQWYIADANHNSSPRSGIRALLARIAGLVSGSSTRVVASTAPVKAATSEDCAEHATPRAQRVMAASVPTMRYRGSQNVRSRTTVPPLKR